MLSAGPGRRRRTGSNLGATALPRRSVARDPMQAFDALPPELRRWLANAALPWSPQSCRRIWLKAGASGASVAERLARLDRAERQTLARDQPARTEGRHGPGSDRHGNRV